MTLIRVHMAKSMWTQLWSSGLPYCDRRVAKTVPLWCFVFFILSLNCCYHIFYFDVTLQMHCVNAAGEKLCASFCCQATKWEYFVKIMYKVPDTVKFMLFKCLWYLRLHCRSTDTESKEVLLNKMAINQVLKDKGRIIRMYRWQDRSVLHG